MPRPQTPFVIANATGAAAHNPKRHTKRKAAPQPTGPLGDPPNYFDDSHRDAWREIERTVAPGVLKCTDRFLVEYLAKLIVRLRSRDPEERLTPVEQGHFRACLGSMGLTPADRGRVTGSNEPKAQDPLDIILGARGSGKAN